MDPLGEHPRADRREVQRTLVVDEREEPHVAVALSRRRDDAEKSDQDLVSLEPRHPADEVVHGSLELLARDRVVQVGMDALHLRREDADVRHDRRIRLLRGSGRAGDPEHEQRADDSGDPPHSLPSRRSSSTQSAHAAACSARSMPRRSRK